MPCDLRNICEMFLTALKNIENASSPEEAACISYKVKRAITKIIKEEEKKECKVKE